MSSVSSNGMVPNGTAPAKPRPPPTSRSVSIIAAGAVLYLGATWLVNDRYYQLMLHDHPIWAVVGVAFNIFSGYSGLISFGHAAFFGLGAYTVALLFVKLGITPWFGIVVAGFAGAVSRAWSSACPRFACAATTSRWRCSPIRSRCSTCSSGWATRKITLPMMRDDAGGVHAVRRHSACTCSSRWRCSSSRSR